MPVSPALQPAWRTFSPDDPAFEVWHDRNRFSPDEYRAASGNKRNPPVTLERAQPIIQSRKRSAIELRPGPAIGGSEL